MKLLHIEWKHLARHGGTCARCAETGKSLDQVFGGLAAELGKMGIEVSFSETLLNSEAISQSNQLLFNGALLEELLPEVRAFENRCESCCELIGQEVNCRAVEADGEVLEAIPAALIYRAALKAVGMPELAASGKSGYGAPASAAKCCSTQGERKDRE